MSVVPREISIRIPISVQHDWRLRRRIIPGAVNRSIRSELAFIIPDARQRLTGPELPARIANRARTRIDTIQAPEKCPAFISAEKQKLLWRRRA